MAEDPELAAAAAAALGGGEPEAEQARAGATGWTEERRARARETFIANMRKGRERKGATTGGGGAAASRARPKQPPASEAAIRQVVEKTVANMIVMGGFLTIVAPYTGIAIAGVPHPDAVPDDSGRVVNKNAPPLVRSRAMMAGELLEGWARKDERVLDALRRFNGLFEASAGVEVVGSLGAALAVDLVHVDPDLSIDIGPFQGENALRPVYMAMGDVVDYVGQLRELQAQAAGANGHEGRERAPGGAQGAQVVEGDVTNT